MSVKVFADLNRDQVVGIIRNFGKFRTVLVEGETGIGKSTILTELSKMPEYKGHKAYYMDLTTKDTGDICMPKIRDINGDFVCDFVPNIEIGLHEQGPILLMLDELGKASRPVRNSILRLMLERRIGDRALHPDSIIFATTNLAEEGLGDELQAHQANRIMKIRMRKPNDEEWIEYALEKKLHPTVVAFVQQFPQCLFSVSQYKAGTNITTENGYIRDPRQPKQQFFTPRSAEAASEFLQSCGDMPRDVLTHGLAGLIGERAAQDMMSINDLHSKLPTWKEIMDKPEKAIVPDSAGAKVLLVYTAIGAIDSQKDTAQWMKYVTRLKREEQALFASAALKVQSKAPVISAEPTFLKWAKENKYLYAK